MENNYNSGINQPVQSNVLNNQSGNNKKMLMFIVAIIAVAIVLILIFNKDNSNSRRNSNSQDNFNNQTNENDNQVKIDTFQANIYLLSKEENGRYTPIFDNYKPNLKIGGEEIIGTIILTDGEEMVMPGEEAFVTVKLDRAITIQEGMNFEIYEGGRKVGTGIISKSPKENSDNNNNTNSNSNSNNYQKVTIGQVNSNTNLSYDANGAFFMYVEDVFSIASKGTIVTGKISRGTIKVGDEIQVLGTDGEILTTQVVGIEKYRKEYDSAQIGDNVGLILKDVQRDQVQRGEALVAPNTMIATTDFEADIHVLLKSEGGKGQSIISGYQPVFAIGPTTYNGNISTDSVIKEGEDGKIYVRLSTPIAMEVGTEINICEGGRTVATGKVTKVN